jgi:hypothetical protein
MFSLLLASINIHYNVSLSERINSFHLQLPEIASAKAPNISHSPASQRSPPGLSDLHPRDLHHLAIGDHALGSAAKARGMRPGRSILQIARYAHIYAHANAMVNWGPRG